MQNQDLIHYFDKMHVGALAKYGARYDNSFYRIATNSKPVERVLALQDEAMAMCGSPYYSVSFVDWAPEELVFLALFV